MGARRQRAPRSKKHGRYSASRATIYKRLRRLVGTQREVAKMLEVDHMTISRRENGKARITNEFMLAMERLAERKRT